MIAILNWLLSLLVCVVVTATPVAARAQAALSVPWAGEPYAHSTTLRNIVFDWSSYRQLAYGSDNWPTSWASDGTLYTSFGDGGGFGPNAKDLAYVSLGFARLTGNSAATIAGENLVGGLAPSVATCPPVVPPEPADTAIRNSCANLGIGGKSRGVLAIDDMLYVWWTPSSATTGYKRARLLRWNRTTNEFVFSNWKIDAKSPLRLIFPTFMQAGQNLADSEYVYTYATHYAPIETTRLNVQLSGSGFGEVYLMRAAKTSDLLDKANHRYYAGLDAAGQPIWGDELTAKPVFVDRNGAGPRVSAIYVKALQRYLLVSPHTRDYAGNFGIFQSKTPWGPWKIVFYGRLASADVPDTGTFLNFLPNSFSEDGLSFTIAFTGTKKSAGFSLDGLNLLDGRFERSLVGAN